MPIYFLDVPVYRLSEEQYYCDRHKYVENVIYPEGSPRNDFFRVQEIADPSSKVAVRECLNNSYGGCWRFNEIIGYIRLYFLGSQIRGEYYGVRKKRIIRTRRKILEYQTHKLAPEIEVPYPCTSLEIFNIIQDYLRSCGKELPGRYIDINTILIIGEHVDWFALYRVNMQS